MMDTTETNVKQNRDERYIRLLQPALALARTIERDMNAVTHRDQIHILLLPRAVTRAVEENAKEKEQAGLDRLLDAVLQADAEEPERWDGLS